jgi:hypothetical protein
MSLVYYYFEEKLSNNAILFIYFRSNCYMHFNMRHIVGFRKIISFKMGIKKYTKLFKKTKLISSDHELLFEKKLVYVMLIVL